MIYELVLFGTYYNQQIVNRFNYIISGIPASVSGAFALAAAFAGLEAVTPPGTTSPLAIIKNMLASTMTFTEVSVAALYSVTDFYATPFVPVIVGGIAGESMSPAVAYGLRTSRVRTDIRRGMKRFAGVPEASVGGGGVLTSTALGYLGDAADVLADTLAYDDEGNTLSFTPAILGRQEYNPSTGLPADGTGVYRKYPTLVEQLEHVATGFEWQPYDTVRTQRSRQYGHGA